MILELHGPWFRHPDGRMVDAKSLPVEATTLSVLEKWAIEVESGINWSIVCHCGSEDEAERRSRYFQSMRCFSGRKLRIRKITQ